MNAKTTSRCSAILLAAVAATLSAGCNHKTYDPAWATRPYPKQLHQPVNVDIQVFRRDTNIEIVNSTGHSYSDVDLWVNQRYVRHVDSLPAGKTITLSLWDFHDEHGDAFYAGGFFRTYPPTPVRLVEIQTGADQPLIGLVAIRSEEVRVQTEQP